MKKQLLAVALLAGLSTAANASVIEFKGSLFGGNDFEFDLMDFQVEDGAGAANVTQTDTNNTGNIIGPDSFTEFGGTNVIGFSNNGAGVPFLDPALHGFAGIDVNYGIFFDYSVTGSATQDLTGDLQVTFDTLILGDLYVLWDADNSADGSVAGQDPSWETRVDLASFSLVNGGCDIDAMVVGGAVQVEAASSCNLTLSGMFDAGYMFDTASGDDLADFNATNPATIRYSADVNSIDGLLFNYPGGAGSSQDFTVSHDANLRISVPEPSTIAILGLGLLGLARLRRK